MAPDRVASPHAGRPPPAPPGDPRARRSRAAWPRPMRPRSGPSPGRSSCRVRGHRSSRSRGSAGSTRSRQGRRSHRRPRRSSRAADVDHRGDGPRPPPLSSGGCQKQNGASRSGGARQTRPSGRIWVAPTPNHRAGLLGRGKVGRAPSSHSVGSLTRLWRRCRTARGVTSHFLGVSPQRLPGRRSPSHAARSRRASQAAKTPDDGPLGLAAHVRQMVGPFAVAGEPMGAVEVEHNAGRDAVGHADGRTDRPLRA